ncbi:MAG: tetratricopeptide repeat protein [Roseivirga sp.]|nr:tetratricopeptide repeat protein [Roseivirga sp.]
MLDSQYDSAMIHLNLLDSLARFYKNKPKESSVQSNYGWISRRIGNLDSAMVFYDKAISIDREIGDTLSLISNLNSLARIVRDQARYSESAIIHERAFDLSLKVGDSISMASTSNNLGNVYLELLEYEKALSYYDLALKVWESKNRMSSYSIALHNKGDVLRGMGEFKDALKKYKDALRIKRDLNRSSSAAYSLTGLGRTYILLDSIDEAEEVLKEALEIRSKSRNKSSYAESLLILSRVSAAKKQYRKAESQLKEVEQIATDYNKADLLRDAFEDQRALYKAWGKLAKLAVVDESYDIMTDSLYREEKLKVQEAQSAASLQREQQKTLLAEQNVQLTSLELQATTQRSEFRLILIIIAMLGIVVIAWQLLQIRKRNAALITLNSRIKLITDNAFHSQKNALGLISALLRSKARQSQHEKELEVLKDVESKIEALGGVAKSLFQRRIEDNTAVAARVRLKSYLEELVDDTFSSVASRAELDLSVDDIETTSTEALNIGLITNEAVTNFSKYAESAGADTLLIRINKEGERLHLNFTDNGPGFPEDFEFHSSTGFGMQMMANLVEDMDGKIAVKREDDLTLIEVEIPLKA